MEKMRFQVLVECFESFVRTDVRGETVPDSRSCRAKTSSTKWDVTTSDREKVGRGRLSSDYGLSSVSVTSVQRAPEKNKVVRYGRWGSFKVIEIGTNHHIISYNIILNLHTTQHLNICRQHTQAIKVSACEGTDRYSTYTLKSIPMPVCDFLSIFHCNYIVSKTDRYD